MLLYDAETGSYSAEKTPQYGEKLLMNITVRCAMILTKYPIWVRKSYLAEYNFSKMIKSIDPLKYSTFI